MAHVGPHQGRRQAQRAQQGPIRALSRKKKMEEKNPKQTQISVCEKKHFSLEKKPKCVPTSLPTTVDRKVTWVVVLSLNSWSASQ